MDKRILLLDDDSAARDLIAQHLSEDGYDVMHASSGKRGLEIILSEAPRLLVANMQLPEMDGLHLCRALRAHDGIGYTFIIMLTSSSDENEIVAAFDAGADDYLVKPLRREELLGRVRAGERIVRLESDLAHRNEEIMRYSSSMAIANQKLLRVATTDELTGLINRREGIALMKRSWRQAVEGKTALSVVACDIDHFKRVNDTFGHDVGDLALKAAADVMARTVRRTERVCRIGGEEFLIVCPHSKAEQTQKLAERVRKAIQDHTLDVGGHALRFTISLGVAERTPEMHNFEVLLKAADDALYRAKHNGRNRVEIARRFEPLPAASQRLLPVPTRQAGEANFQTATDGQRPAAAGNTAVTPSTAGSLAQQRAPQ